MPQGKWEISKLLDEFEKELLSRERINILNSDNLIFEPPLFSGSSLHLQAQKGSQKQIRFHVLIVNKTTQAINVQLLPMSKLENKFLSRCFNSLRVGHVVKNCTKPQKCYICQGKHHMSICNSKIQNPKSNDSRNPPKNVTPKGIPQQTPEQEADKASVNQVISSVENLIQNENIGNDTTTTLFAENFTQTKISCFKRHKFLFHLSTQRQKDKGEFYLIIVLKKVST